jgi:hypothetical protein
MGQEREFPESRALTEKSRRKTKNKKKKKMKKKRRKISAMA